MDDMLAKLRHDEIVLPQVFATVSVIIKLEVFQASLATPVPALFTSLDQTLFVTFDSLSSLTT
jgi:hypothetical protein